MQRKVETAEVSPNIELGMNALRGGGQSLAESARSFFEPRFGYDFGHVRIHSDSEAGKSARAVSAKAFTLGRDVVFGAGQYKPESEEGKSLLAHELVHTIQQAGVKDARTHLHRTLGDGHDLTSPRFAGDERLEACYDDEARLTKGAQGDSVRKVQQALIDLGYDIGPTGTDGIYGDHTWNAVKQFKTDQALGWEWMGDVGPGTIGRLDELFPSAGAMPPGGWETPPKIQPPTVLTCPYLVDVPELADVARSERVLQKGDSGEGVSQVQQVLLLLGYPLPQYGADSRFGDETESGIKKLQYDNNLNQSGLVDNPSLSCIDKLCAQVKKPSVTIGPAVFRNTANRIAPNQYTNVPVIISSSYGGFLLMDIEGSGGANGTAVIAAGSILTASSDVTVMGVHQTARGTAGRLRVRARIGNTVVALSPGFTVAAYPTNVSIVRRTRADNDVDDAGGHIGLSVEFRWSSDGSGSVSELNEVAIYERVEMQSCQNPPFTYCGVGQTQKALIPANSADGGMDWHLISRNSLNTVGLGFGHWRRSVVQLWRLRCNRTGRDMVIPGSGFHIDHDIYNESRAAGFRHYATKFGAPVIVLGDEATAGNGTAQSLLHNL